MLNAGASRTIEALPKRERVNRCYMRPGCCGFTLLAPDIIEAILDGRQPEAMRLENLLEGFPGKWDGQREYLGITGSLDLQFARYDVDPRSEPV